MFEHMSEEEVDDILRHMERGGGDGRVKGVSVVALLKMMDNKNGDYAEETKSNNNRKNKNRNKSDYNEDDEDEDEDESKMDNESVRFTAVEYDFSPDPETRSLEKKLRSLGHALSKKGVDVEGMFRDADARLTGMVKRTEFVEVMSKIGLSVLEKGDALDEARLLMNGSESEGPGSGVTNTDARKMQLMQMKRLKGREGGYANNAARAARSLVMNAGANSNDGRVRGNFKVRYLLFIGLLYTFLYYYLLLLLLFFIVAFFIVIEISIIAVFIFVILMITIITVFDTINFPSKITLHYMLE